MLVSDMIAQMIEEMLREAGGDVELQRKELAERAGCVPSQINYVITSRFTPERGYVIESRRGGGGYIRIIKKQLYRDEYLMHVFHALGRSLDARSAEVFTKNLKENGFLTDREAKMIYGVNAEIDDDAKRADIMRQIMLAVMK